MSTKEIALALATAAIQRPDFELTEQTASQVVDFYLMVQNSLAEKSPPKEVKVYPKPDGF